MTDDLTPPTTAGDHRYGRRGMLRGGALLAGAAGAAALVMAPTAARAADGDAITAGEANEAESTTSLRIGGDDGAGTPTLSLQNADGPSLFLQPLAYEFPPELELGEIANTELGPIIGVDSAVGLTTSYLATGVDLADLPTPYALPVPTRLLDTRNPAQRAVLRSSAGAFDAAYQLRPGAWVDIEVAIETDEFELPAAFVNVSAVVPQRGGHLSVYPPRDALPGTSTLNFQAKTTLSNQAFVATGIVSGRYAIRVRTTALTHLVVDLTGVSIRGSAPVPAPNARSAKRSSAATSRLRSTLTQRVRAALTR